jgi:hypothetical protein
MNTGIKFQTCLEYASHYIFKLRLYLMKWNAFLETLIVGYVIKNLTCSRRIMNILFIQDLFEYYFPVSVYIVQAILLYRFSDLNFVCNSPDVHRCYMFYPSHSFDLMALITFYEYKNVSCILKFIPFTLYCSIISEYLITTLTRMYTEKYKQPSKTVCHIRVGQGGIKNSTP